MVSSTWSILHSPSATEKQRTTKSYDKQPGLEDIDTMADSIKKKNCLLHTLSVLWETAPLEARGCAVLNAQAHPQNLILGQI